MVIWEFPKIRGTIWGVPILRIIVFWGLHWGPLILGNYHIRDYRVLGCEAAAMKSGLPPCVREPEAALWWICSAVRGWQM